MVEAIKRHISEAKGKGGAKIIVQLINDREANDLLQCDVMDVDETAISVRKLAQRLIYPWHAIARIELVD